VSQKNAKKTAAGGRRLAYAYEIVATHAQGSADTKKGAHVDQLNKPAVLVWKVDPQVLALSGVTGFPLRAYMYNEKKQSWEEIPSTWDSDTNQLIATTSLVGLAAVTDSFDIISNYLPTIKNYETNLQSGTANVGFPIELPPGPGGFGPRVMLSYNSGSIDRVDISQQGPSSVGWGWTLSTNYIAAIQRHYPDRLGCADNVDDPGYHPWIASIVLDGTTGDLIEGTDGYWHTEKEQFVRIQYHAGVNSASGTVRTTDWWEAWDKSGTRYEFKSNALIEDRYNWAPDPSHSTCDGTPNPFTTYRWMLTTATDVHGNAINYTYKYEDRTQTLQATPIPNNRTQAVYPYQITWGANGDKLQATFSIVDRTIITNSVPISDVRRTEMDEGIYQTRRVDGVQIKRLPTAGGAYSLLRAYQFEQDYSIVLTSTASPNVQYPHLTLAGIVPIGSDGVTKLPKTTFRYVQPGNPVGEPTPSPTPSATVTPFPHEDHGHLWWAYNGYGGAVGFYYDAAGGDAGDQYRRVRAKRVQDGLGTVPPNPGESTVHDMKYFYDYRGGNTNTSDLSADADLANTQPLYEPGHQFRGFAWVREQDPMGQVEDHYFTQDDTFKGPEWRVQAGKELTFTDIITGTPSSNTAWSTSAGVFAATDPYNPANGAWKIEPSGPNPTPFAKRALGVEDGTDVSARFMVRTAGGNPTVTPAPAGWISATWRLENTNGDYWGLQVYHRDIPSNEPPEAFAKVVWKRNGTIGERDLFYGQALRPRLDSPIFADNWYRLQLHTSADGRFALELYDDQVAHHKNYIQIKSGDPASTGGVNGLIPSFDARKNWTFVTRITSYDTANNNYSILLDDYTETRTVYGQSDSVYESKIPSSQTTTADKSEWRVGYANNADGMLIRFVPVTEKWTSEYVKSWPNQVAKRTRTTYTYDAYGNPKTINEYGNVDPNLDAFNNPGPADERSTVFEVYPNTTSWIVNKVGQTRTYSGTYGAPGAVWIAEVQNGYDGQTDYTLPPTKGDLTLVKQVGILNNVRNGQIASQQFGYDTYGNKTFTKDPNNNQTSVEYDTYYRSFPLTTTLPNGRTEITRYNFSTGYNISGVPLDVPTSRTDMNGTVTESRYDVFGRPLKTWIPTNNLGSQSVPNEEYTYSDVNPSTGFKAPFFVSYKRQLDGTTSSWETRWYDGIGRVFESLTPKDNGSAVLVSTTYTKTGQVESVTNPYTVTLAGPTASVTPDPNQPKTTKFYDGAGRNTMVVNPDGTNVVYDYMSNNIDRDYSCVELYDETVGLNQKELRCNDLLGRAVLVNQWDEDPTTTYYVYDMLDHLTKVKRLSAVGDVTMTYDGLGRKNQMVDSDSGTWQYDYDAAGNVTARRDAIYLANPTSPENGKHQVFMEYDSMNRIKAKYYGSAHYSNSPTVVRVPDVLYRYDNDLGDAATKYSWGRLRHVEVTVQGQGARQANGHGYEYDVRGLVVADVVTTSYGTRDYRVGYTFDTGGRITSTTYPDPETTHEQTTFLYNAQGMGLPRSIATNNTVTTAKPVYDATYNARGQLETLVQGTQFGSGDMLTTAYTYDDASTKRGWLTKTKVTTAAGATTHLELNVAYKLDGNISQISQVSGGTSANPTFTNNFTYDGLERMRSFTTNNTAVFTSEQVSFDQWPRMTSRTIGGVQYNYTYDATHVDRITAFKGNTYAYDDVGNQTSAVRGGSTQNRTYDPQNRVTRIVEGNTTTEFVYDGEGKRLVQSIITSTLAIPASKTALFVVDNPASLNTADTAIRSHLQGLGYTVTVADDDLVASSDATGKTLVFISATSLSGSINTKLRNVAVPVIVCEPYMLDDMGMTDTPSTQMGAYAHWGVRIADPSHPLAGGLTGDVTVTNNTVGGVVWGIPNANAIKAATLWDNSTLSPIFAYAAGVQMYGLTAPAKRVGFYMYNDMGAYHNENGWRLFDAAVNWAAAPVTKSALFVVDAPNSMNASDTIIRNRLRDIDYNVTVVDDDLLTSADATGKSVVFVSATSMSTAIGTKLRNVTVPVINCEPYLMDDMGMTDTPTTQMGAYGHLAVRIADPAHPVADGFTGDVTVSTNTTGGVVWGIPNANALKVATLTDNATLSPIFAYTTGAQMYGLTAPAKRVGFYLYNDAAIYQTAEGRRLFDAAVNWAAASVDVKRTLYVGNLYEEQLTGPDQSATAHPYTNFYFLGSKMVGMRRVNYPADNGQQRMVGDHLGSTTLLVDTSPTPAVLYRAYYKPYGEVAWQTGTSRTSVGFTGQRLDAGTKLMYFGARYYDPELAHFVSADPTTQNPSNAMDYNRYLYAHGNPLRFIDQLGFGPEDYYIFVQGCTSSTACDRDDPSDWGEYGEQLKKMYDEEGWGVIGTFGGQTITMPFEVWAKTHVKYVGAKTLAGGAEGIRKTIEGITDHGPGVDIHLLGHSEGGAAVAKYLLEAADGKGADSRVKSAVLIDAPLVTYQPGWVVLGGFGRKINELGSAASTLGVNVLTVDTANDWVSHPPIHGIPEVSDPRYPKGHGLAMPDHENHDRVEFPPSDAQSAWHDHTSRFMAEQTRDFLSEVWK
jgi:RHS repeat-associated protein